MATFNNQQPNQGDNSNRNSINTRGIRLYNINGFYPSAMNLDFWNDVFLSISIYPAKAKELQTEKDRYDYDNRIAAAVTVQKGIELLDNMPRIIEAFKEDKDANCYVDIANTNLFGYGTMKVSDRRIFFVGIHRDLDDNRIPRQSAYFEFTFGQSVNNYDPKTGNYELGKHELGEFAQFKRYLETAVNAATHAVAHSIRAVNDFYWRRMEAKLDGVVKATNAVVEGGFNPRYGSRLFGGQTDTSTMKSVINAAEKSTSSNSVTTELPSADAEIPF